MIYEQLIFMDEKCKSNEELRKIAIEPILWIIFWQV